MKEEIQGLPRTHDTVVVGIKDDEVVFLKGYYYQEQKDEAQSDLKRVIDAGLEWRISDITHLTLSEVYKLTFDFVNEIVKDDWICDKFDTISINPKLILEGKDYHVEEEDI